MYLERNLGKSGFSVCRTEDRRVSLCKRGHLDRNGIRQ